MNTMNPLTGLNAAERHQATRADRWRRRSAAVAASLPNWRTEARTRLLIRIYLGSLAFGLIIGVVQVFWRPALFAWLAFTVVMLVAWTMLRTVINTRDVAPDEELDEYEQETIRNWQAHRLRLARPDGDRRLRLHDHPGHLGPRRPEQLDLHRRSLQPHRTACTQRHADYRLRHNVRSGPPGSFPRKQ